MQVPKPRPRTGFAHRLETEGATPLELDLYGHIAQLLRERGKIKVLRWPFGGADESRDIALGESRHPEPTEAVERMRSAARFIIEASFNSVNALDAAALAQELGREVLVMVRTDSAHIDDAQALAESFGPRAQFMVYEPRDLVPATDQVAAFARGDRPFMPLDNPDPEAMRPYLYVD